MGETKEVSFRYGTGAQLTSGPSGTKAEGSSTGHGRHLTSVMCRVALANPRNDYIYSFISTTTKKKKERERQGGGGGKGKFTPMTGVKFDISAI